MTELLAWASDPLVWASLGPLLGAWFFRRHLPKGAWWLAAAFGVSFVGEVAGMVAGTPWWPSYLWLPVQIGLALTVVAPHDHLIRLWSGLTVLAIYDMFALGSTPDIWITALGSAAVLVYALQGKRALACPIVLYFGAASALYFGMVANLRTEWFWPWFWAYQGVRVLSWLAYAEVLRERWFRGRQAAREQAREQAMIRRDNLRFGLTPLVPAWPDIH